MCFFVTFYSSLPVLIYAQYKIHPEFTEKSHNLHVNPKNLGPEKFSSNLDVDWNVYTKLSLYEFLNNHNISLSDQKYLLNEFNKLNKISSISNDTMDNNNISKVTTIFTHLFVYYIWHPVKGSNNDQYHVLMFKILPNNALVNLSNTIKKDKPFNVFSLDINGTEINRGNLSSYNNIIIQYIKDQPLIRNFKSSSNLMLNLFSKTNSSDFDVVMLSALGKQR